MVRLCAMEIQKDHYSVIFLCVFYLWIYVTLRPWLNLHCFLWRENRKKCVELKCNVCGCTLTCDPRQKLGFLVLCDICIYFGLAWKDYWLLDYFSYIVLIDDKLFIGMIIWSDYGYVKFLKKNYISQIWTIWFNCLLCFICLKV